MHQPEDPVPPPPELRVIRSEIDRLDLTLVDLIARRAALARSTVPLKSARGMDFRDHHREAGLVRRAAELARERGIDPEPVRDIFWKLVELSHRSAAPVCAGDGRGEAGVDGGEEALRTVARAPVGRPLPRLPEGEGGEDG